MTPREIGLAVATAAEYARHLVHDDGVPRERAIAIAARAVVSVVREAQAASGTLGASVEAVVGDVSPVVPAVLVGGGSLMMALGSSGVGSIITGIGWVTQILRG